MTLIEVIPHLQAGKQAHCLDWGWRKEARVYALKGFPVLQIRNGGWTHPDVYEMYTPTIPELLSDRWEVCAV